MDANLIIVKTIKYICKFTYDKAGYVFKIYAFYLKNNICKTICKTSILYFVFQILRQSILLFELQNTQKIFQSFNFKCKILLCVPFRYKVQKFILEVLCFKSIHKSISIRANSEYYILNI